MSVEELKAVLQKQARAFGERMPRTEASLEDTGGLPEGFVGEDQRQYSKGAETDELAGSASGCRD